MMSEERGTELEAENARLREQLRVILAHVRELEARLAKDNHNSGNPPSSEGLNRTTRNQRKRSSK